MCPMIGLMSRYSARNSWRPNKHFSHPITAQILDAAKLSTPKARKEPLRFALEFDSMIAAERQQRLALLIGND